MKFYKIIISLFYPLIYLYLLKRMLVGKEDKKRFSERLGKASVHRPDGKLVWLHGASIGEINSFQSIISFLQKQYPDINLLLTSGTVTSAPIAEKKYPNVIHQYVPIDVPFAINRFMTYWHPDLAIRVDSDFWPLQLDSLKKYDIPNILLNGSVTEKAYQNYLKHPNFTKNMMLAFSDVLAKSEIDANRLKNMGAENVVVCDNIKFTNDVPTCDENELKNMKKIFENKKIWHAAVLGEGEEDIILSAHKKVLESIPNSLLIITPRHPKMGKDLYDVAKNLNLNPMLRSANLELTDNINVYIADTLGEMGLFYRLSNISFMGRSLLSDCRGSSPIEAIKLGSVIMVGPYTSTFDEIYDEMKKYNIVDILRTDSEIADKVIQYISNTDNFDSKIVETQNFVKTKNQTMAKIVNVIEKYL